MGVGHSSDRGFTLLELMTVVAIVALLAGLLLPALSFSKIRAAGVACSGNLRQLGLAAKNYADDHLGSYPVSAFGRRWTTVLRPGFIGLRLLRCPSDRALAGSPVGDAGSPDSAPRSYLFNGFSDFVAERYPGKLAVPVRQGIIGAGLPELRIREPAETILFGEKSSTSDAWEVDVLLPNVGFLGDLEEARHGVRSHTRRGGANYLLADGGARFLRFGQCTCPLNLWGITEASRTDQAICRPH